MSVRRRLLGCVAALALFSGSIGAQQIAPGDTVHLRLLGRLASHHHEWPAPIRAVIIAPVTRDGRVIVPPGSVLSGEITGAGKESFGGKRHWVGLRFDSVTIANSPGDARGDSMRAAIALRILAIDDSRESVDSVGRIVGPPIPSIIKSKRDWAVLLLGVFHPVGAVILAATLEGEVAERHRAITLDPGTEMTARVTNGATLAEWPRWSPPPALATELDVDSIAASLPLRAELHNGRAPSDVIAIALLGTPQQVQAAFAAAGWTLAVPITVNSDFVTFMKAAKGRGYEAQPVSELDLGGRPPELVYEKVADTFMKRHHFRVWRWPATSPLDSSASTWLIAATHDTGIMFSKQRRTFTHRVNPHIDDERDKIVNDLVAANAVSAMSYATRTAPADGATVNGGRTPAVTDWRLTVVKLR